MSFARRRSHDGRWSSGFDRALVEVFFEEIQQVRVSRASGLLAGTDLPISVLAEQSGFSNLKHLELVFRREMGTTPSSYRRQFRASKTQIPAKV